jgi:hypothetical protein
MPLHGLEMFRGQASFRSLLVQISDHWLSSNKSIQAQRNARRRTWMSLSFAHWRAASEDPLLHVSRGTCGCLWSQMMSIPGSKKRCYGVRKEKSLRFCPPTGANRSCRVTEGSAGWPIYVRIGNFILLYTSHRNAPMLTLRICRCGRNLLGEFTVVSTSRHRA